jgi:hypothetical protein
MSVWLLAICPPPGSSRPASANELARKIINNEYQAEARDHSHWMFQLEAKKRGSDEVKEVIEAKSADLEREMSINGKPLSAQDEQKQERRIQQEIHDPDDLRRLQKEKSEDIERTQRMLRMLPDAFNFSYGERRGDLMQLKFAPNPNFRPPSREARVFHAMEGDVG